MLCLQRDPAMDLWVFSWIFFVSLVEVNAPWSAVSSSPGISSLPETIWTSRRERYWKRPGEEKGSEKWAEDLKRAWGCSYEQRAFGVCFRDSVQGTEKWNIFNNGWSRGCHSLGLLFFFLGHRQYFRQGQHCQDLTMKPEGRDSDVCQTLPIYQLDTGLCSKYFLCICWETRLCPQLQHEFAEAEWRTCCWKTPMDNSCHFSMFLFPLCPWSPKKAATAPLVIMHGSVLGEDHVLSTVLWSKVSPGLRGHDRARPASVSISAARPPGHADLQPWQVSKHLSVCLRVFCQPFDAQRGGKSGRSR